MNSNSVCMEGPCFQERSRLYRAWKETEEELEELRGIVNRVEFREKLEAQAMAERERVDPVIHSHNHTPHVTPADARLIAQAPMLLHWLKREHAACARDCDVCATIHKAEGRDA